MYSVTSALTKPGHSQANNPCPVLALEKVFKKLSIRNFCPVSGNGSVSRVISPARPTEKKQSTTPNPDIIEVITWFFIMGRILYPLFASGHCPRDQTRDTLNRSAGARFESVIRLSFEWSKRHERREAFEMAWSCGAGDRSGFDDHVERTE